MPLIMVGKNGILSMDVLPGALPGIGTFQEKDSLPKCPPSQIFLQDLSAFMMNHHCHPGLIFHNIFLSPGLLPVFQ